MAWNRNTARVISAALAVEREQGRRPWTAAELISFLDDEDGSAQPSDATVYRLLHRLDEHLGLLVSVTEPSDDTGAPGRPMPSYELTPAGLEAAAGGLCHNGRWARLFLADYRT